jgi:serine/threonine protein kinase
MAFELLSQALGSSGDSDDEDNSGYCSGIFPHFHTPYKHVDYLAIIGGALYLIMTVVTLLFIRYAAKKAAKATSASAEDGHDGLLSVSSVIFPSFVKVLYIQAGVSLYTGVVLALVPINPGHKNNQISALIFASVWSLQHAIIEGIAVLLQQKGCGQYATINAAKIDFAWTILTFGGYYLFFNGGPTSFAFQMFLDVILQIYYGALWFSPLKRLFRRPALILYAKYWFLFRGVGFALHIFLLFPLTMHASSCGYYFFRVILFSLFQPLLSYQVMLNDSMWWQGLSVANDREKSERESEMNISDVGRGNDFSIHTAQTVAEVLDRIKLEDNVRLLNFAYLRLKKTMLGEGSFSRVYLGKCKEQTVAIKRINTADLTIKIINRIAAEASILSAIRHRNVVGIFGVAILPPSICIVLELCKFGSLSNIIRGYETDIKKVPALNLSTADKIHLALGCARGLSAVHSFSPTLCHRDVKSFNFLVDSQLTVKIADLELGDEAPERTTTTGTATGAAGEEPSVSDGLKAWCCPLLFSSEPPDESADQLEEALLPSNTRLGVHPSVKDMQAMWLAPEVLRTGVFTQASDVYSLSLVLWEIRTSRYPFDHCKFFQAAIQDCILQQFRHEFPPAAPSGDADLPIWSEFDELIRDSWNEIPSQRPTAQVISQRLEQIMWSTCVKALNMRSKQAWSGHSVAAPADMASAAARAISSESGATAIRFFSPKAIRLSEAPKSWSATSSNPESSARTLRNESLYSELDANKGAWVAVSSVGPNHAILHRTAAFNDLISGIVPSLSESVESSKTLRLADILMEGGYYIPQGSATETVSRNPKQDFPDDLSQFLNSFRAGAYGHLVVSNADIVVTENEVHSELSIHGYGIRLPSADDETSEDEKNKSDEGVLTIVVLLFTDIMTKRNIAQRFSVSAQTSSHSLLGLKTNTVTSDSYIRKTIYPTNSNSAGSLVSVSLMSSPMMPGGSSQSSGAVHSDRLSSIDEI